MISSSSVFFVVVAREDKKKKQKQDGCETEEKTEILCGSSMVDQGSKSGGGASQQPLKRGQKVREECESFQIHKFKKVAM